MEPALAEKNSDGEHSEEPAEEEKKKRNEPESSKMAEKSEISKRKEETKEEKNEVNGDEKEKKAESSKKRGRPKSGGSKKAAGGDQSGGESKEKRPKKRASKEPSTPPPPTIERPTRDRKSIERFGASAEKAPAKGLQIAKGRGTVLKEIPNVAYKLSKRKADENIMMLHTILYRKRSKKFHVKSNISQFSGFVWSENEEKQRAKVKEKLDRCVKEKLLDFCDVLDIPVSKTNVKKEEVAAKLLEFLESPHATTEVLLAEKAQKGKKRRRRSKGSGAKTSRETPVERSAKKRKKSSQTATGTKGHKRASKSDKEAEEEDEDNVAASEGASLDEDDEEGNPQEEESGDLEAESGDEEDEPEEHVKSRRDPAMSPVKNSSRNKIKEKIIPMTKGSPGKFTNSTTKSSPKKGASVNRISSPPPTLRSKEVSKKNQKEGKKQAERKQKAFGGDKKRSTKQQAAYGVKTTAKEHEKGKAVEKAKTSPSKEELQSAVSEILKEVDFNTATLSDIIEQLGKRFNTGLMHRKSEVKKMIEEEINNMSDDEDDGAENEENGNEGEGEEEAEQLDNDGDE